MKERFNAYEFIGIAAPGAVTVFVAMLFFDKVREIISSEGITLGGFGIFLVLSYVIGHLVQAIGNFLEKGYWYFFSGMPTNWILTERSSRLINENQKQRLEKKINDQIDLSFKFATTNTASWFTLTREIHASIRSGGDYERIEAFNRNYGLLRGIAAAMLISIIMSLISVGLGTPALQFGLLFMFVLSLIRMHRFGVYYARELFLQYLTRE